MTSNTFVRAFILGASLASACAASRPRTETVAARRLDDTAPDRSAALRAATPGLELEAEDARWGIEAAKERRRARDPRAGNPQPPLPAAGASTVDVKTDGTTPAP
ncbi:MAG TPA: hypothetical protein VHL80_16810 [Polyangia bacterium]|nr:hypothetical protein [Polyangia bacterium]